MKQTINETAKKILAVNARVLKGLHDTFGFKFEENSSVDIVEVKAPFTLNKVIKENNITNDKFCVMMLLDKHQGTEQYHNRFYCVVFDNTANFVIDNFDTGWKTGIDSYYRKSDFNEERKTTKMAFLVMANKEDVNISMHDLKNNFHNSLIKNQKEILLQKFYKEENHRIKYDEKDIRRKYFNNQVNSAVYGVYNAKMDNCNIDFDIDICNYGYYIEHREINDIIDKSGYNVYVKRDNLRRKVQQIKAERELNALQRMDFSKQNEIIRVRIFNTKNDLIEKLQNASFDDTWKTNNESNYLTILDNLRRLNSLYSDYIKHVQKIQDAYNNKQTYYGYNSPDKVLNKIVEFNDALDKLVM